MNSSFLGDEPDAIGIVDADDAGASGDVCEEAGEIDAQRARPGLVLPARDGALELVRDSACPRLTLVLQHSSRVLSARAATGSLE